MGNRSQLIGFGMYVPPQIISNDYFSSYLDTSDQWIFDRTGISERRWASVDTATSDLAANAAKAALANAGMSASSVDGIIVATSSPDFVFPSTACVVQKKIGATKGFAFDINAACAGFVYALTLADSLIKSGQAKNMLIIGADIYSSLLDKNDRSTCVLFGDGAGAVLLTSNSSDANSGSGILGSKFVADGNYDSLLCYNSGTACRTSADSINRGDHRLNMEGREIFKLAVRSMSDVSRELLGELGLTLDNIDAVIAHQANMRILSAVAKELHLPDSKMLSNVKYYGNTSAATIPILLAESLEKGHVKQGDTVLFTAFGAGLAWGSNVVRL